MRYVATVEYDEESEEHFVQLDPEAMEAAGFRPGDVLDWKDNGDGSYTLTKKKVETQLVLVETISQFRIQYVVEVPVGIDDYGNDKTSWALDTVTMEEAHEFNQKHLGETIVSHRVISDQEALDIFRKDDPVCARWSDDLIRSHFNRWEET